MTGTIASEELTYAPGDGPFHAKGTIYLGTQRFYAQAVPGGLDAVLARLSDPRLIDFLRQKFIASAWYDVGPLVPFGEAAARAAGTAHLELLRTQARAQAQSDIHGIYRLLLKLASPEMVMSRLPRAASQYFDFVRAEVRQLGPRRWESIGHGIPATWAATYMATTEAFVVRALELAGAKNVRHRWHAPETTGVAKGIPTVSIRRELGWG